ncbi:hypothetical protein GOP47_0018267, partial [Adiantum capillus-veneris]
MVTLSRQRNQNEHGSHPCCQCTQAGLQAAKYMLEAWPLTMKTARRDSHNQETPHTHSSYQAMAMAHRKPSSPSSSLSPSPSMDMARKHAEKREARVVTMQESMKDPEERVIKEERGSNFLNHPSQG